MLRYPAKDKYEEDNYTIFEVFWHDNDCCDNHIGWQMNRHHFKGAIGGGSYIEKFRPEYVSKMIVIGTIHDDPQLLEEERK